MNENQPFAILDKAIAQTEKIIFSIETQMNMHVYFSYNSNKVRNADLLKEQLLQLTILDALEAKKRAMKKDVLESYVRKAKRGAAMKLIAYDPKKMTNVIFYCKNGEVYTGKYIDMRLDRKTIPKEFHVYECRHEDDDWVEPVTIETGVILNFAGTFLTKTPIQFLNEKWQVIHTMAAYFYDDEDLEEQNAALVNGLLNKSEE